MKKGMSFLVGKDIFLNRAMTSNTIEATPKRNRAIGPGEKSSNAALMPENAEDQIIMAIDSAIMVRAPNSLSITPVSLFYIKTK
jgi:hypothetical protein